MNVDQPGLPRGSDPPSQKHRPVWILAFAVVAVAAVAVVWQRRPAAETTSATQGASAAAAATSAATRAGGVQPNEAAPLFTVADLAGAPVQLAALRGQAVVVYFLATNACVSCEDGARKLTVALDTVGADSVEVVAVDYDPSDTAEALEGFARRVGSPPFRWVLDTDTTMAETFQPRTLSEVIVIGADGVIIERGEANAIDQATLTGWVDQAATR